MPAAVLHAQESLDDVSVAQATTRALGVRLRAIEPLPAGLGARRFFRILTVGDAVPARLIARVEAPEDPAIRPPGAAPEPPLEPLRTFLEAAGLPVPRSYGRDPELGIDWLEDLGDLSLADLAEREPERTVPLLRSALDSLPRLQALRDPGDLPAFRRRLDPPMLAYKGELFAEHALPHALGRPPRAAERAAVSAGFAAIATLCEGAPRRLAHRDFQSRNLLVERAADGDRLRWIDLQGAFLAPPEYDAVCLLADSYLAIADDEVAREAERLRPRLPDAPPAELFALRFDALTVARKGKDQARFVQAARRGDRRWLRYVPATAGRVRRAAARAAASLTALGPLAELLAGLPEEAPCGG